MSPETERASLGPPAPPPTPLALGRTCNVLEENRENGRERSAEWVLVVNGREEKIWENDGNRTFVIVIINSSIAIVVMEELIITMIKKI